jgi:bifunctional UDP-N-acetylglucosamine pyrophosphorylase/glucosamine-1-phosphate N-acetyltransferase
MVKTIVLLAAGRGTRMRELSQDKPKHLIHVNGRPFLYYLLKRIQRAGFAKIILVVGYKKEKMYAFVEQYRNEFSLSVVNQYEVVGQDKYGTACPVMSVEKLIAPHENFVVVNADDILSLEDYQQIARLDDEFCYVGGAITQHPEKYGLLQSKQGYLKSIKEKPQPDIDFDSTQPKKYLINSGLYKFTSDIFSALQNIKISPRGEYELTDAVALLGRQNKVKIFQLQQPLLSFGQPEDIPKMEAYLAGQK